MLLTALAALTFACSPSPTAPEPLDVAPLFNVVLPGGDTLRLTLTYMCGNRWRVRNPHAQALDVTWDVFRTTARGALTLPARPEGAAFSESFFETPVAGTTRLFYQSRLVQTKAHGNRACTTPSGAVTIPAPASLPSQAFYDSLPRLATNGGDVVYMLGVLMVRFDDSTSLRTRQEAVDAVGGQVVGGGSAQTYYVRLPQPWTAERTFAALALVTTRPGVQSADPGIAKLDLPPSWLRAVDAPGDWSRFALSASDAGGLNGALEAIRAPLAWGCSTGASTVGLSIIDNQVENTIDLAESVSAARNFTYDHSSAGTRIVDRDAHGTRVAHVAAAKGNNGVGITGVVWNAKLEIRDVTADPDVAETRAAGLLAIDPADRERRHLIAAGRHSLVINYSRTPSALPNDTARVRYQNILEAALSELAKAGRYPLVVIAAGNADADAALAGPPAVAARFSNALVVGGSTLRGLRWPHSNKGALVTLSAPADTVGTLGFDDQGSIIGARNGTSYAAPLVAGAAVLLAEFDPRLATATRESTLELKRLLTSSARTEAGGVPMLDAYGALKAAAQRPGAPLCGNRVWADSATVKTQRASTDEVLFTAPGAVTRLYTHHGGKRLDVEYLAGDPFEPSTERATYRWSDGRWTQDASGPAEPFGPFTPGPDPSGASRSSWGISHDFTEFVAAATTPDPAGVVVTAFRSAADGSRSEALPALTLPLPVDPDSVCVFSHEDLATGLRRCGRYEYSGSAALAYGATYSPLETEAYAVIGGGASTVTPASEWTSAGCFSSLLAFPQCRTTTTTSRPFGWLIRWRFDGTAPHIVWSFTDAQPVHVSLSEDGAEAAVLLEYQQGTSTSCAIEWFDTNTRTRRDGRTLASTATCRNRGAPFTFAALRTIAARP